MKNIICECKYCISVRFPFKYRDRRSMNLDIYRINNNWDYIKKNMYKENQVYETIKNFHPNSI